MLEFLPIVLAGLGLYFMGVSGIRSSLQQVPGIRFRESIGRASRHPVLAAVTGFLLGTVTQTSIGVAVIFAGLIARGLSTVRQALPVIAWSNMGLVVLVFLNNLPVTQVALFLIGFGGICANFGFGGRFRGLMPPLYSLGMLLYGLRLMKDGLYQLSAHPQFESFMAQLPASELLAFAFGALLRIPVQSSSAVALIGITMYEGRIFTEQKTIMLFYGTSLGTGFAAYFLTSHLKGEMRQVALFEAIVNLSAGVLLLGFFYLEKLGHFSLLEGHVYNLTGHIQSRLALVFLLQQSVCVAFAYLLMGRMSGILEKLAPRTVEQDLSRPRFIHDEAAYDIETGLSLAKQEIKGLVARLPDYLRSAGCESSGGRAVPPVAVQHQSFLAVINELQSFLAVLSDRRLKSHLTSVNLLQVQRRLDLLCGMEEATFQVVHQLQGLKPSPAVATIRHNVIESLDALLLTALDAFGGQQEDIAILERLTSSPGEVAHRLRQDYMNAHEDLGHEERAAVVAIITQQERVMWLLNQISKTLEAHLAPTDSVCNPLPGENPS
ncbi:MAG: hypothetical protein B9S32_13420 [Verrucomicrobia bacterium Tous-C9LFEB]|nr:MAG: hypothetical protein B9S32_13420 [Verrucomicrobia bacterium Tous-C9LFEB]